MHKEEMKDEVKDSFGTFESQYLRSLTSKFPRLLVHCYNAVEKEARDLLPKYFHDNELDSIVYNKMIKSKLSNDCLKNSVLETLNEDGSIDMELLKQISRECLRELNRRHFKRKRT